MKTLASLARSHGFDVLIPLAALECALEIAFRHDAAHAPTTTRWLTVPAVALVVLPLLARRRLPFAAPAAVWLIGAALSLVDGRLVVFSATPLIAGIVAAFLLGSVSDDVLARVGLAIVLGGAGIVVYNSPDHAAGELVFTPLLFGIGWLAGYALRERGQRAEAAELRASRAEHERETAARIAVAEERARIARELHDIVAHSVSVMVLQVGAVRHKLPAALAPDVEALRGVEQTGRSALAEMRLLLGAMRSDGDDLELSPRQGLDRLAALIDEIGRAGLPVRLQVEGEVVALPAAIDLSAYRIVQEGLTNALKHARAGHADVAVRYGPGDVSIEVRDDGSGPHAGDGLGHGLIGVRERVKIYGGEMSAGPAPGGGFVLTARLPVAGHVR
ncbi:MAG TPA: sensor histidine kinase [Gaiellales bacterium]